ncbi:MAG: SIMPL domain-containing protein [Planctomycetaceae bacterium]
MKRALIVAALLFAFSTAARPAAAQLGMTDAMVTGAGAVILERQPELMRLRIDLIAKGDTLEAALAALDDRAAAAKLQVVAFGAGKDSVQVGEARITDSKTDQQKQMEQMLAQRLRQAGRGAPAKTAETVTVAATLEAEWPLQAKNANELLLAVHPLQKKIIDANLAGTKDGDKLSAEEQEMMEEFGGYGYGGEEEKPGTPAFYFVAPIPQEELDRAAAEAFQKAKAQAERLAAAAGVRLGSLAGVNDPQSHDDYDTLSGMYGYHTYSSGAQQAISEYVSRQKAGEASMGAVGDSPKKLRHRVSISAAFRIDEGK